MANLNRGPAASALPNLQSHLLANQGKSYTFATLPTDVNTPPGSSAWTSDQGLCVWNGSAWIAGISSLNVNWSDSTGTALVKPDNTTVLLDNPANALVGIKIGILGDSIVQDVWATGPVALLSVATAGSGYANGTYGNVSLSGGVGSGATATFTVSGGVVTAATISSPGTGYQLSDTLTPASFGGGSSATVSVSSLASIATPTSVNTAGNAANFVAWAAAYSFGRLKYTAALAQGGFTIQNILDNLKVVYAGNPNGVPDITVIEVGFNDISGVTTQNDAGGVIPAFITKYTSLITQVKALGSYPVCCTISPKNSAFAGYTLYNNRWIAYFNAWLRNYCRVNHITLFDYANYITDPSDTINGSLFMSLFQGNGQIVTLGAITGGTGYTNGFYVNVATTTSGSGTGCTINATVAGGAITKVAVNKPGTGYAVADTISSGALGGGTGFSVPVATASALVGGATAHVHPGQEITRALGYELWTNLLAKICPVSPAYNYVNFGTDDQTVTGVGQNLLSNTGFLQSATVATAFGAGYGTTTMTATGSVPYSLFPVDGTANTNGIWAPFGNATSNATYSIVAHSSDPALSTLNTTGLVSAAIPGNWAQCSMDTSVAANKFVGPSTGVGFVCSVNFSYGGYIALPQKVVVRLRVKATALANCAGITVRVSGGLGGFFYMNSQAQGISPQLSALNNVTSTFDTLYETPPFTVGAGWGNFLTIYAMAVITNTAAGTTTFQISQPEVVLVAT